MTPARPTLALVLSLLLGGVAALADAKFTSTWGAPEARTTTFELSIEEAQAVTD